MILICYDGSVDAQAAIDRAGQLMPGSDATVLVIWETILEMMARNGSLGMGFGMAGGYDDEADGAIKQAALETAADGSRRATAAGLHAQSRIASRHDEIAGLILAVASDVNADLIVLGTRGLGSVKSAMLGSVSHAVLHHADRPVLVIPSPALCDERRKWTAHVDLAADAA